MTTSQLHERPRRRSADVKEQIENHAHTRGKQNELPQKQDTDGELRQSIASSNDWEPDSIEALMPCTPMQNGLLSLASRATGDYIMDAVLELDSNICLETFRNAWATVCRRMGILRTRFIYHDHYGVMQVVLRESMSWDGGDNLKEQLKKHKILDMGFGKRLSNYSLVKEPTGRIWFIWTIHHALYDGWLLSRITSDLGRIYRGYSCQKLQPFSSFVEYVHGQDDSRALEYWRSVLSDFESTPFPTRQHASGQDQPPQREEITTQAPSLATFASHFRDSTLVNAAWALVARQHGLTDDVVFGTIASGRSRHIPLTLEAAGPTITTVPVRIQVTGTDNVGSYLRSVQAIAEQRRPFEQIGLKRISTASSHANQACNFETLLVLHPQENDLEMDAEIGTWRTGSKDAVPRTYALTVQCFRNDQALSIRASFDKELLSPWIVERMLCQFSWTLQLLARADSASLISQLGSLDPAETAKIWTWNSRVPPRLDRCVHDIIVEKAAEQPEAVAVQAWNGSLSYGELDTLSSCLAVRLIGLGLKQEDCVPLCFEKSLWTSVAMLGVLRAGGTFVLLDPTQPQERLREIVTQLNPHIMLTSTTYASLDVSLDGNIVSIDENSSIFSDRHLPEASRKEVHPASNAYVIFTSGSTGKPKGVCIPHHALASSCYHHGTQIGFSKDSRVLQFASYTFDAAIMELITTLMYGGCICVPSADQRLSELSESIRELKVNTAFFTPSVSRILDPSKTPLETVLIGGEISREQDFTRWSMSTKVMHMYGPTECTIFSCMNTHASEPGQKDCIGWGMGSVNWVVDHRNDQTLAPLGVIGELLIEGPIVGKGYLNDLARTASSFIDDPPWLLQGEGSGNHGRRGRLYKTGDLVQYNRDGSLRYIGRKDTQVKIRGQRVELGEVEHHLRENLPAGGQIAAEVVACAGSQPMLVAFVEDRDGEALSQEPLRSAGLSGQAYRPPAATEKTLRELLPAYMVPAMYLRIERMPIAPSGKTDRKRLRLFVSSLSLSDLSIQHTSIDARRMPKTDSECAIQRLWAKILCLDANEISLDDDFFRLGGDSIAAMRLAGAARSSGIVLSVADIFRYSRMEDAAKLLQSEEQQARDDDTGISEVPPFGLLLSNIDSTVTDSELVQEIAATCHLDITTIQDVYPCTPLQEGLFALSLKSPGNYILTDVLDLWDDVNLDQFKFAWAQVVRATPILRTRIVQNDCLGRLLQVVVDEEMRWYESDDVELYCKQDESLEMAPGQPLVRYGLARDPRIGNMCFVWTIHHTLYDGISLPLILDLVKRAYIGLDAVAPPPFQRFIQYIMGCDMEVARQYWLSSFEDFEAATFPPLPPSRKEPVPDSEVTHRASLGPSKSTTTLANIIRAAWAVVVWQYTSVSDVVFGTIVSGRNAPVKDIETTIGPTIGTVPIRVQLERAQLLRDVLLKVQEQAAEMIPYEQMGLRQISATSESAARACDFQTLLVVQAPRPGDADGGSLGSWRSRSLAQDFSTYALTIACEPAADGTSLSVTANFDSQVLSGWMARHMLGHFSWVLQQLTMGIEPTMPIADLVAPNPEDHDQLWEWNKLVPSTVEHCVQDLIAKQVRVQPSATAIQAWDGSLTYGQLDELATRTALVLTDMGVNAQSNPIIPMYFEKSMWTSVAVLAVLKAGGAFVLLDPLQPSARLAAILTQIQPRILLTSTPNTFLPVSSECAVLQIAAGAPVFKRNIVSRGPDQVDPASNAYIIFTSGSTGTPKGVCVPHSALSSSCWHHGKTIGFSPKSRVLQFASYSFDATIMELVTTLVFGGCICIPSAGDRMSELAESMRRFDVNTAFFTPSVSRIIEPSETSLDTILIGGEISREEDFRRWSGSKVMHMYGPTECTIFSSMHPRASESTYKDCIGWGMGSVNWVVDSDDAQRLVPLGALGELLIEGPIVARGYLDDPGRTAAAFIENPIWLTEGPRGRQGRLYKTGDLVRYNEDGSLSYVGRKDTQVKVRGQRIELGEVEHHIRQTLPAVHQVAAEVVVCATERSRPMLVAFLELNEVVDSWLPGSDDLTASGLPARVFNPPANESDKLRERLPSYMVPTLYLALPQLPSTPSGKIDRKHLRGFVESLPASAFATLQGTSAGNSRPPRTRAEHTMQQLWARVLGIHHLSRIGLDDDFFRLGGDSISAMKLAAESRKEGLALSVADIFRCPKLESATAVARYVEELSYISQEVGPFSLVGATSEPGTLREQIATDYGLSPDAIEDAYPCTPLQEGLLALSLKSPGNYIFRGVQELSLGTSVRRFKSAWQHVIRATPILRTRIVNHKNLGLLQAVIADDTIDWTEGDDLEQYLEHDSALQMDLGKPLTRYGLIQEAKGKTSFVWTAHHAVYDGMSLPLIFDLVRMAYDDVIPGEQPKYNQFVNHVRNQDQNASDDYWRRAFEGYQAFSFPQLSPRRPQPIPDAQTAQHVSLPKALETNTRPDAPLSSFIRAALALAMSQYSGSSDVVFGAVMSGRNASLLGVDKIIGPTIATVPVRVQTTTSETMSAFVKKMHEQAIEMIPYEQTGLPRISALCKEAEEACSFQTLLVIQSPDIAEPSADDLGSWYYSTELQAFTTYALTITCQLSGTDKEGLVVQADFDSEAITPWIVSQMLGQFAWILERLLDARPESTLAELSTLSPADQQRVWKWNEAVPPKVDRCVHDLISEQVHQQPDAPAVEAWDGRLTYKQLDDLATHLSAQILNLGMTGPDTIVPVCFEKSMWTSVAILAVVKSGNAFVLLDPAQPLDRLSAIVAQTSDVIVSSVKSQTLCSGLASKVVVAGPSTVSGHGHVGQALLPRADPSQILYAVFTSGSTGTPKGVLVSHSSYSSAVVHQAKSLGFHKSSRVFDFSSYTFDVAIENFFMTLANGGCLCVPSERDRKDGLLSSIEGMRPTLIELTPSVAKILAGPSLDGIETLVVGGEALHVDDVAQWPSTVHIINSYGPSECTATSTINTNFSKEVDGLGKGFGVVTWVVDADNHEILAPLGTVGELLLEGPIVGCGYLNDPVRTAAAFIEDPAWLTKGTLGHAGRRSRLYKTGDLVRYNDDGSLSYAGRKDTQVKIRGQRVELSEVEHYLHQSLPDTRRVVAEVVTMRSEPGKDPRPTLVAFVEEPNHTTDESRVLQGAGLTGHLYNLTATARDHLSAQLPAYMIPATYFVLQQIPASASGKTDRKRLREFATPFSAPQLAAMSNMKKPASIRMPATERQRTLQELWARVLGIKASLISLDDDFFQLGGDSISAMKLAAESRTVGLALSVVDIFRHPRLEPAAELVKFEENGTVKEIAPFTLLENPPSPNELGAFRAKIAAICGVPSDGIEDAYPCTPLQEGLLALSQKRSGDYVLHEVLKLSPDTDLSRFKEAWENVVQLTPVLRTRIVQYHASGMLQVVVSEGISWNHGADLEAYLKEDSILPSADLGQPLARYGLIYDSRTDQRWFVWTIHHALYDGVSLPLVLDLVAQRYSGITSEYSLAYRDFIRYITNQDFNAAKTYWRKVFEGFGAAAFPSIPAAQTEPVADSETTRQVVLGSDNAGVSSRFSITLASFIRAAWALVVGQYGGSTDTVFGAIVSGRNAPVKGIEASIGPTVATVPIRVAIDVNETVHAFVERVQDQAIEMIAYEQTGLQRISGVSDSAKLACSFQTLLVVQAPSQDQSSKTQSSTVTPSLGTWQSMSRAQAFTTYALTITCHQLHGGGVVEVQANFDSSMLEPWLVNRMLDYFSWALRSLIGASPTSKVKDLWTPHAEDMEQIWKWNETVPPSIDRCVHDLIIDQARLHPSKTAICAWDGDLTYQQLDNFSTRLALQLVDQGIVPGTLIPLCFEKSMWTTVAILGVLRAGAAFVLLDHTYPIRRLSSIVSHIQAPLIISSENTQSLCERLIDKIVTLGPGSLPKERDSVKLPLFESTLPLYVVFTSGSTGKPKGVEISHSHFSSAITYQAPLLGFRSSSRVYDFSSYSFDMAIENAFMTLASGGCLCVPSEAERKDDLLSSIRNLAPTLMVLTPSVIRVLGGSALDSVQTLVSGGEALHLDNVAQWPPKVHVINSYGPAECTAVSTINKDILHGVDGVGKGAGAVTWIVDQENCQRLLPIGAVGELLIEGPIVGSGYLGDPERTAEVFVHDPAWLGYGSAACSGRDGRLYRTGDLVRYDENGGLVYVARKDTQVKIRGQRVELSEVEHHLQQCVPTAMQVVAEVVASDEGATQPMLVAFIEVQDSTNQELLHAAGMAGWVYEMTPQAEDQLRDVLPVYMVPSVYFAVDNLPITASGKLDRKQLRNFSASFSVSQLAAMHSSAMEKRLPQTETERMLRDLWARTLRFKDQIGLDDNFFRLGGDSITAMKLAAEARVVGFMITVADIFRTPKLGQMAAQIYNDSEHNEEIVESFSLLGKDIEVATLCEHLATVHDLKASSIEDAYPCTALQEGLLALSLKSPGDYILRDVQKLSSSIDVGRFKAAWTLVTQMISILRTRIVQHNRLGLLQVVLTGDPDWAEEDNLEKFLQRDRNMSMELGQPLSRYGLVHDSASDQEWFIWTVHHAIYDGISRPLILDLVHKAYHGTSIVRQPEFEFKHFVAYVQAQKPVVAHAYWRNAFEGYESVAFPPLPPTRREPVPDSEALLRVPLQSSPRSAKTLASFIRAAWALVVWRWTGSTDVVFGAIVSGRSAPVRGISQVAGPTIATVPVRIQVNTSETLDSLVEAVQTQAMEMIPFEQTGLQQISNTSVSASQACDFQTLMVLQTAEKTSPRRTKPAGSSLGTWQSTSEDEEFLTYALTITCQQRQDDLTIQANFDSQFLAPWAVHRILGHFSWLLQQLMEARPGAVVSDVVALHPEDATQLREWNAIVPSKAGCCVHKLITQHAQARPDALAVSAWDGNLTYSQLDKLSTQLARRLANDGLQLGSIIPICSEKSMWTSIGMLAVAKAGSAFVLLEPSQPRARLQAIIQQTKSNYILSSVTAYSLSRSLVDNVTVVGQGSFLHTNGTEPQALPLPSFNATSILYTVFTSGSTGTPKGVLISHDNFTSALQHQTRDLLFSSEARHFDFMSYTFDVAVHNSLATFASGGCLCVPSEDERKNDLSASIMRFEATSISLTPSVARLLDPRKLPSLQSVVLIGEAVTQTDATMWSHIKLVNGYGPAECTPYSTAHPMFASDESEISIGKGIGAVTWVADPQDDQILSPIGAVGELLLEGPIVGQGYLGDKERTEAAFIENPPWLTTGGNRHRHNGRIYKTGDLVRYTKNGNLVYVGRKDTQVKIRGQRLELGEVEYHLRQCLPNVKQAAAEVVTCFIEGSDKKSPSILVAFIESRERSGLDNNEGPVLRAGELSMRTYDPKAALDKLRKQLPDYMVPSVYLMLEQLPITPSGKTDRKVLRNFASLFSARELSSLSRKSSVNRRPPLSEPQITLQQLWAQILHIDPSQIALDDNFFRLGGDSISAMKLAAEIRAKGMILSVSDVFHYPKLEHAATVMRKSESRNSSPALAKESSPFSLLRGVDANLCREQIAESYRLDFSKIEDIYPCTPLQEGLLALSLKSQGGYVFQGILELSPNVQTGRFRAAWEQAVKQMPVLRTRIVQHCRELVQVVLANGIHWNEGDDLELYLQEDADHPMNFGQPLARYGFIHDKKTGRRLFVWTVHHALYDRASLSLILDSVIRLYHGEDLKPRANFQGFVQYITEQDARATEEYWKAALADYDGPVFPQLSPAQQPPTPSAETTRHLSLASLGPILLSGVTLANYIRAAWALTVGQYSGSPDIVYGAIVSGRSIPVPGIEEIIGPVMATVPVRMKIVPGEPVAKFLSRVQDQAIGMLPYEHTGLRRISAGSESAERVCGFQSLLIIQPPDQSATRDGSLGSWQSRSKSRAFMTYALNITCQLASHNDDLDVQASFDDEAIMPWKVECMLNQFEWNLRQLAELSSSPSSMVGQLGNINPQDGQHIWNWNQTVPMPVNQCVHDLITDQMRNRPNAVAIDAWDGTITYEQLDNLATGIALQLLESGLGPGEFVPLFFEKSQWASVAMLGVLKAGGAFVLLDPAQPEKRLAAIVAQLAAKVTLSSLGATSLAERLVERLISVGPGSIASMDNGTNTERLPRVSPENTIYAVFTSGSTGTPKGVLISHSNLSSALEFQQQDLLFSATSRHFDFMSYTFDVAIHNVFATFVAGGCLCVPSEEARRNDLANAINGFRATSASLTPSVARLLNPDKVTLTSLVLIGEPVTRDDARLWRNIHLVNGYGPAECTPYSTARSLLKDDPDAEISIGKGIGAVTWVTDPDDHQKLVPLGATGELLIEGPIVGHGYLKDPTRTAEAFIRDPIWLTEGTSTTIGRRGRLYKTGDLVRYSGNDGRLAYVGRKDTQVKIRGQRLELAEVENHVQHGLRGIKQAAAEIVNSGGESSHAMLVAFVVLDVDATTGDYLEAAGLSAAVFHPPEDTKEALRTRLPDYMIPAIYFALSNLPSTPSGKVDRKRLRTFAGSFSAPKLASLGSLASGKAEPETGPQLELRRLWSQVLSMDPGEIGLHDNFFRLGGDSISCMHLVGLCRDQGLHLTVAQVFQHPQLQELAANLDSVEGSSTVAFSRLSLVTDRDPAAFVAQEVIPLISTDVSQVSDVLPLTEVQRLFVENELVPRPATRHYFHLDYPPDTPELELRSACSMLSARFDALRAIFFRSRTSDILQAIPRDLPLPIEYHESDDSSLESLYRRLCLDDWSCALQLGQPFTKFHIIQSPKTIRLMIRLSHAQYDGISLDRIAAALGEHYQKAELKATPTFSSYVYHRASHETQRHDYWRSLLAGSQLTMLKTKIPTTLDSEHQVIKLDSTLPAIRAWEGATPATIFTSACAAALAQQTGRSDVVFGRIVSGRESLSSSLQDVVGPCLSTIPVRVWFGDTVHTHDILQTVQDQYVTSIPHEATSLEELATHCTNWGGSSAEWGIVSQYQNIDEEPIASMGAFEARLETFDKPLQTMKSRSIIVFALPEDSRLKLSITASAEYYDESQIHNLSGMIRECLEGFETETERSKA